MAGNGVLAENEKVQAEAASADGRPGGGSSHAEHLIKSETKKPPHIRVENDMISPTAHTSICSLKGQFYPNCNLIHFLIQVLFILEFFGLYLNCLKYYLK